MAHQRVMHHFSDPQRQIAILPTQQASPFGFLEYLAVTGRKEQKGEGEPPPVCTLATQQETPTDKPGRPLT